MPVLRSEGPLGSGMVASGGGTVPGDAEEPAGGAVAEGHQLGSAQNRIEAMELQHAWARWLGANLGCLQHRQAWNMLERCADLHLTECRPWVRMRIRQWMAYAAALAARKRAAELLCARRA